MTMPAVRHTKIIFTLGPATESEEVLERLLRAGVDVCRLNMAHAGHAWTRSMIRRVRAVAQRVGREIALMMDIKGPEIRTGDLPEPLQLQAGEIIEFTTSPDAAASGPYRAVDVNYPDLVHDVQVGDIILVDNGLIRLQVLDKPSDRLRCRILVGGRLASRRHINLPGVKVNLPSFTAKDRADTLVGLEEGIDYLALSFVREASDLLALREFLRERQSSVRIIAKIEDQSAIANLDAIVRASDALMVARGDLGIECPFEELPLLQRNAVRICQQAGRPVIIATHLLESMIGQPLPTRAEITDVANAVEDQVDCVMLSGETTVGLYPLECVQILDKVARRLESETAREALSPEPFGLSPEKTKVLHAAVVLANQLPGALLVTFTRLGYMAQALAAMRPRQASILAFTPSRQTCRHLCLVRGVEPYLLPLAGDPDATIQAAIQHLRRLGRVQPGQTLVVATDILAQDRRVDAIQLRRVD